MTSAQFKAVLGASPFQTFDFQMADGRSIRVTHPELVLVTPGGRTVVVAVADDAIEIIDLLLVTSLRTQTAAAS